MIALLLLASCMTGPCKHVEPCCYGRCFTVPVCVNECATADLDGDCDIDLRDYALLQNAWGPE